MKTIVTYFILSLFLVLQIFPQKYWERRFKDYTNPDELVTMAETLPFNEAVELLSKVSESMTGKRIVNATQISDPIGIEIVNMPYDKAMVIIVQYANLRFEEKADIIVIKSKEVEEVRTGDTYASVNTREVKISAVFFEMDVQKTKKIGIDWKILLDGESTDIAGLLRTEVERGESESNEGGGDGTTEGLQPEFNLGVASDFSIGSFFGQATAVFKFFEKFHKQILPIIFGLFFTVISQEILLFSSISEIIISINSSASALFLVFLFSGLRINSFTVLSDLKNKTSLTSAVLIFLKRRRSVFISGKG